MHLNRAWGKRFSAPLLVTSAGLILAAVFAGTSVASDETSSSALTTTSSETSPPTTPPPGTTTPPPGTTTPPPGTTTPPTTPPPVTTTPPTTTPPPPSEGGCTPGFWKNHPEAYAGTGYSPTTTLGSVFTGLSPAYASLTFDVALALTGGGRNALLRHAVAALLNASSPDVDYPLSAAEVISLTNAAIASGDYEPTKDLFDKFNDLTAPGFCD
jgi:hypothetical protein